MNPNLHAFIDEGRIFTSLNASSLLALIPPIPRLWNSYLGSDPSPDNIKDALTTRWVYETRPSSLHLTVATFYEETLEEHGRIEQKLMWCQTRLAQNMPFSWYGQPPPTLADYGIAVVLMPTFLVSSVRV
jgi:hypothetical protein